MENYENNELQSKVICYATDMYCLDFKGGKAICITLGIKKR